MRLAWTPRALADLGEARAYIAIERPVAADRQVALVLTSVGMLLQFPETGRPGREPGTRELVVGRTPFVAIYRLRGEAIEIIRVLHGRQRWPDPD